MTDPQILDISLYQGAIDWRKLAQMHVGVIARMGQGDFEDVKFPQHYQGALEADVPFGVYWFYQPNQEPGAQVTAFLKAYNALPIAPKVIALDVEDIYIGGGKPNITPGSREMATYGVSHWLAQVEAQTGQVPGIYTRENYWTAWMLRSRTPYYYAGTQRVAPTWSHYWLWIAAWYVYTGAVPPRLPLDWTTYKVHQYEGGTGTHPAVTGPVDRDYFNGTEAEMYQFFGLTPPPAPPTTDYESRIAALEAWAGSFGKA